VARKPTTTVNGAPGPLALHPAMRGPALQALDQIDSEPETCFNFALKRGGTRRKSARPQQPGNRFGQRSRFV
jgi:hypothetical protein